MSGSLKLGLALIGIVLVTGLVINIVRGLVSFLTPFLIVGGVGLVIYGLFSRKPLGGGRRYLP